MPQQTFLVTGATGATGRSTVALLLAHGHRVRALVHQMDARSAALAQEGAEVIQGDLLQFQEVQRALAGIDGAYFVFPVAPGNVQAAALFAQAAREAEVAAIVNMSQILARPDTPSQASRNQWIAERVFDESGLGVTHLRPTIFAEWLLYFAGQVATDNVLALPFHDNRVALIAAEDQARVIAAILEQPAPHRGQTYSLYGAVEMTFPEVAEEMSQVLGRTIHYHPLEGDDLMQALITAGFSTFAVQHVVAGGAPDFQAGRFAGMNDLVNTVGGQPPMTVRAFIERHRAAFGTKHPQGAE